MSKQYSDTERAAALSSYDANGGNLDLTARQLDIPRNTLRRWVEGSVNGEVSQMRQGKNATLLEMWQEEAEAALELAAEKRKEAKYGELITAAAIATDKIRNLTETVPLTEALEGVLTERRRLAEIITRYIPDPDLRNSITRAITAGEAEPSESDAAFMGGGDAGGGADEGQTDNVLRPLDTNEGRR